MMPLKPQKRSRRRRLKTRVILISLCYSSSSRLFWGFKIKQKLWENDKKGDKRAED